MRSRFEEAVSYDGDLLVAANEVIAELDDQDGVQVGSDDFKRLLREKAKEHNVSVKDLRVRVKECL